MYVCIAEAWETGYNIWVYIEQMKRFYIWNRCLKSSHSLIKGLLVSPSILVQSLSLVTAILSKLLQISSYRIEAGTYLKTSKEILHKTNKGTKLKIFSSCLARLRREAALKNNFIQNTLSFATNQCLTKLLSQRRVARMWNRKMGDKTFYLLTLNCLLNWVVLCFFVGFLKPAFFSHNLDYPVELVGPSLVLSTEYWFISFVAW